jgi:formyltetrahydrofolate deformylase
MNSNKSASLLVYCPDQSGIIASVTNFIKDNNGNISYLEQHVDDNEKVFFMRIEWELNKFIVSQEDIANVFNEKIAVKYKMQFEIFFSNDKPKMAVFVSKQPHCLYDILSRYKSSEWQVDIPLIISNHMDLKPVAENFGLDFHFIPVSESDKISKEKKQLKLLTDYKIDFIVLARYMQILSEDFISNYQNKIINIHHSFLPAFPGAKPYHSAFSRGVKIIGATSHFVTNKLDEGPIIEQDVVRVSHLDSVTDMIRKGRDLEKIVLSRSIYKYLQRKILTYKNKTVVFN